MPACFIVLLLTAAVPVPVHAQDAGQIINVNQSYQIAFTDLGSAVLKQGDVVKVSLGNDEFVYMQVLEVSSILSKLGPVQSEDFKTNYKDLQRIAVGNAVSKAARVPEKSVGPIQEPVVAKTVAPPAVNDAEMARLQKELMESKMAISRLAEANKNLQSQISNAPAKDINTKQNEGASAILSQLKAKLENMNRIIDQNE